MLQFGAIVCILRERLLEPVDEVLVAKGFLQKIESAVLHGLDRHGDITVSGDEDHGNRVATQIQLFLELQAAHSRHAHVQDQATRLIGIVAGQKLGRRPQDFRR